MLVGPNGEMVTAVWGHMVSIGTLFAFAVVSAGVVVLRRTHPELSRLFRVPWSPVVPVLSAVVSLALMLSPPAETWTRLFVWMTVGIAFYFFYGYRRSRWPPLDIVQVRLSSKPPRRGSPMRPRRLN